MAISFVAYDDAYTNSGTTVVTTVPTGAAAGDMLVLITAATQGRSTTAGAPFAPGANIWQTIGAHIGGSTMIVAVRYRIMESGDTNWTYTLSTTGAVRAVMLAYTDTAPDWSISGCTVTDDTSAATNFSDGTRVSDGVALNIGTAYRSSLLTGISIDNGTSRIESVNTQIGIAVRDSTTGGSFTSTTTGSAPLDHYTFALWMQSSATGEMEDDVDLLAATPINDGYVYKGRDLATADNTGAA
jgi:hypothetical protein